jgi:uncharacterized repeat protein (TIGR01451 family)
MGRRLLVIVGVFLAASAGGRFALAQDEGQGPPPAAPVPVPAAPSTEGDAQNPIPGELKLPQAPVEAEPVDEPAHSRLQAPDAAEPGKKTVNSTPATTRSPQPKGGDPPRELEPGIDELIRTAQPKKGTDPLRMRTDANVMRTQGQVPPATPTPAVAPAESSGAAVDRLPIGKQSVAVTVDVQAPASMNRNQEATFKLIVRNTGTSDALNVDIQDELPEGLEYVSSVPEMVRTAQTHLSFRIPTLAAGSDKVISLRVKPTKTGPFDHTATVRFETGCRSHTRVLEPKLKVEVIANPSTGKVLKGQPVEFKVTITNLGDGPARNVAIQAKLTPGLRHEAGGKNDDPVLYELMLPELLAGHTEKLDTLVADAVIGGNQGCNVKATSTDVVFVPEDAEFTKTIEVVEPKLDLKIQGPDSRFTDTIADYEVILQNPGTAAARKIRVAATLPSKGRLVGKVPADARYDSTTRRLTWTIDQIEPGAKALSFPFHVRMGSIGRYEVVADAIGDSGLKGNDTKHTDVLGMPDVDLLVSESKRVVDVGGTTTFQIRLRNYGTKEATNLQVRANLSPNLEVEKAGGPKDIEIKKDKNQVIFEQIPKLGPGKEMILWTTVKVLGPQPKLATCKVVIAHDDLTDTYEDMAGVKITTARNVPADATSKQ